MSLQDKLHTLDEWLEIAGEKMMALSNKELKEILAPVEKTCPSCGQKFTSMSDFMPHLSACNQSMAMAEAKRMADERSKKLKKQQILQGMKDWAETFFEGNK